MIGVVGTITTLQRFPVKSMAPEALDTAELHWTGLYGDRQYAFVKRNSRSHFPWLTGRDVPEMVLYRARYTDPADPRTSRVRVSAPDGRDWDVTDPALAAALSEAAGEEVALLRLGRGAYDAQPVSVVTTGTLAALEAAHGSALGLPRFRANIVVTLDTPETATVEAGWLGAGLALGQGGTALRANNPIPRCAMVTIDPDSAARDPSVLRTVAQEFGNHVGVYCAAHTPGPVALGDRVSLHSPGGMA